MTDQTRIAGLVTELGETKEALQVQEARAREAEGHILILGDQITTLRTELETARAWALKIQDEHSAVIRDRNLAQRETEGDLRKFRETHSLLADRFAKMSEGIENRVSALQAQIESLEAELQREKTARKKAQDEAGTFRAKLAEDTNKKIIPPTDDSGIVKREVFITTDGIHYDTFDAAQRHQVAIDSAEVSRAARSGQETPKEVMSRLKANFES